MPRRAVRLFVRRRLLRRPWLCLCAVLLAAGVALDLDEGPSFVTGVCASGLIFLGASVAAVWRAHLADTLGRFRAMDPPEADVAFGDAATTVASNLGSATLPWSRFVEVWERPGFWMLFLASNQFITSPLDALTPEVLDFVPSKLGAGCRRGTARHGGAPVRYGSPRGGPRQPPEPGRCPRQPCVDTRDSAAHPDRLLRGRPRRVVGRRRRGPSAPRCVPR